MKFIKLLMLLSILNLAFSCKDPDENVSVSIVGTIQKGPFTVGSKVILSELNTTLTETGRNFNSTVSDDKGNFSVDATNLTQNVVAISADGFYFDEVGGNVSTSRIILNALADVTDPKTLNINVLTHLTFERIKHLVKAGTTFSNAKAQAEKEVLSIFKITDAISNFEKLDIAKAGDNNAALLAISAILQGYHSVGELSELLAKIALDIKEDGKLDTEALKSELINEASILKTATIRNNITKRFQDLGVSATIGDFEKHINNFKTNSGYTNTKKIVYPTSGIKGLNVLAMRDTVLSTQTDFSIVANMTRGTSIKIVIKGNPVIALFPLGGSGNSWNRTDITANANTLLGSEVVTDSWLRFAEGTSVFEIYENGATQPTRTITITGRNNPTINVKDNGKYGKNILKMPYSTTYQKGDYSTQMDINDAKERNVVIEYFYSTTTDITFSNPEGWIMKTEDLPNNQKVTRLTLKGSKVNADVKVVLGGSGAATSNGTIDGVYTQDISKKMSW